MGDRVPIGYEHDLPRGREIDLAIDANLDHANLDHANLDHATVARIIRRATKLAGVDHADSFAGISRAALVAAAAEVGLPAAVVMRSIALEHLGPEPTRHATDRVFGVAVVSIDDEIPGSPDDVLRRIDAWLVEGHHLRRDRVRNGRGEWSKRSGLVGVTVRRLRTATGEGHLGEFRQVTAAAEDIGTGSSAVRVTVDRSGSRRRAVAGGAVAAVGGVSGVVVAAALGPVALVAAPFVVVGGLTVAWTGKASARRTATEVERMLEAVADRQSPSRLRHEVARRVIGKRAGQVDQPSR